MPWLLGGGVLLALLLGSKASTPAAYAPALPPSPQPQPSYQPPPSLQAHLATVLAQPSSSVPSPQGGGPNTGAEAISAMLGPSQGTVTESVFATPPYGSKPGHNQFAWWINHYTGSDYKNGEVISQHDVDDAVHNAVHAGTLHDVYFLQEFATQLLSAGAVDHADWALLKNYIISLQTDAIAPFVELYANVSVWPTPDPRATAERRASWDHTTLLKAIANVRAHGNVADCKNLGMLLMGYTDPWKGDNWTQAGASLIAYANTPAFIHAAAARHPTAPPAHVAPAAAQRAPIRSPSSSPVGTTPQPQPNPADTGMASEGLPAGFSWEDQGNNAVPNPGDTVATIIVGPDGTPYPVMGTVEASDGSSVSLTVNTDSSGVLSAGQQVTVSVSDVAGSGTSAVSSSDGTYPGDSGPMQGG